MSVLYVSHGHPDFAKGGGELAAWRLFEAFRSKPGFEDSGFLASASSPDQLPAGSEVLGLGPDEWLIKRSPNPFFHDSAVNLSYGGQLHQALVGRRFKIIHLHHYLHVGIDLALALKRWFPRAILILTLHDYWGLCIYEGRLLRSSGELCEGGDPVSCDHCLGGRRRGEIAIRALRIRRLFDSIDHFLSPSFFLKHQYLEWGLDSSKISVIENLQVSKVSSVSIAKRRDNVPLVVGFFGQVNPWKGLDFLIEALYLARDRGVAVNLEVNGAEQTEDVVPGVQYNGTYSPDQLVERMERVDIVAMASNWFENSPMVIQEAFQHGRPVLTPRLGGMAEKIRDGQTGMLFSPGDANSLAEALQQITEKPEILRRLQEGVKKYILERTDSEALHELLYKRLIYS